MRGLSSFRFLLVALLLLASSCNQERSSVHGVSVINRKSPSSHRAPTNEGRQAKALAAASPRMLSKDALDKIDRVRKKKGKIVSDRPDAILGLAQDAGGLEDYSALLWNRDEKALAEAMVADGVKVLVLQESLRHSLDRDQLVLNRLYHHAQMSHFSLFRITDDFLLYEVLEKPLVFDKAAAESCIAYLRSRLTGGAALPLPKLRAEQAVWTLMGVIRAQGHEISVALAQNRTLKGALEELVTDLERDHRREVELTGFPPLDKHMEGLSIEIHRVVERAYVEPREEREVGAFMEMGVDGVYMMTKNKKERGVLPGAAAYVRAIRDVDRFLRHAAAQGRMSERRPWLGDGAWLELLRTIHFRETSDGAVELYRGVPNVRLEDVSLSAVSQGIVAAGEWYLSNLKPNGQVTYKMWPSENRYSNEYNFVRHTLSTWNLVQSYQQDPRPEFLAAARKTLEFTNSKLKREDVQTACAKAHWCDSDRLNVSGQMAYYEFSNNVKLGSVVVNMLGMIELAQETGDHSFDEQLREMGRFVKFMARKDGTFECYYVDKSHSYYGTTNDIVPGEAALAMIHLANYFEEDAWIDFLPKFWEHYEPWFQARAGKAHTDTPLPMQAYDDGTRLELVQFGPWTVMAANAYHKRTGDKKVADFGLEVAEWMIRTYSWTTERAPFPDYIGGYYKKQAELPAMQAFCYAEGTSAAYGLALRHAPGRAPYFERATRESVRFGLMMQYTQNSSYGFSRPWETIGGIRYAMNETKIRIDYVYHAQSAMVQWLSAARGDASLPEALREGPALPGQLNIVQPKAESVLGSFSGQAGSDGSEE
jgi:hypothetical protein